MRNRIMSLILLFALVFTVITPVMSFAQDGKQVDVAVKLSISEVTEDSYKFNLIYNVPKGNKGDSFTIETPFAVPVKETEVLKVEQEGNKYTFIFKDDFINVKGFIKGERYISELKEEGIKDVVVNGEAQHIEYPSLDNNTNNPGGTSTRPIEKTGVIKEDGIINWSIMLNSNKEGLKGRKFTDEIGNGHVLLENSLEYYLVKNGESSKLYEMPVGHFDERNLIFIDPISSDDSFNFTVNDLNPDTTLIILYDTKITDTDIGVYSNQVMADEVEKIKGDVFVNSDSGNSGERPKPEPENPDPDKPEPTEPKPEKPGGDLPQVGEEFNILAIGLLVVGLFQLIRSER